MGPTVIEWGALTLSGVAGDFLVRTVDGWDERPDSRTAWVQRPTSHGAFDSRVYARERMVLVSGHFRNPDARDELLLELERSTGYEDGLQMLRVTRGGRTLAAPARLTATRVSSEYWPTGFVPWTLQFTCPDPFRYGLEDKGDTAGLPLLTGGLEFDLFTDGDGTDLGYLEFGAPGDETGRVLVQNDGNADAWPIFLVGGDLPNGFAIQEVTTGRRLMFADAVSPGAAVGIDSATGRVLMAAQVNTNTARFELRGNADRSGRLLLREFTPVPPGGSREFAFQAAPYDAGASMTVFLQDTYW